MHPGGAAVLPEIQWAHRSLQTVSPAQGVGPDALPEQGSWEGCSSRFPAHPLPRAAGKEGGLAEGQREAEWGWSGKSRVRRRPNRVNGRRHVGLSSSWKGSPEEAEPDVPRGGRAGGTAVVPLLQLTPCSTPRRTARTPAGPGHPSLAHVSPHPPRRLRTRSRCGATWEHGQGQEAPEASGVGSGGVGQWWLGQY